MQTVAIMMQAYNISFLLLNAAYPFRRIEPGRKRRMRSESAHCSYEPQLKRHCLSLP